jgi:hypothetical protein
MTDHSDRARPDRKQLAKSKLNTAVDGERLTKYTLDTLRVGLHRMQVDAKQTA